MDNRDADGSPGSAGPFPPGKAPKWTEDETEKLRRVVPDSVSAAQVARDLSEEIHRSVTRGAVIGRCWRLGLRPPWARGPCWHPVEPTPNPFPDNPHGCLWSYGDPGSAGYRFCGRPKIPGKPYCSTHAAVAYVRDKVEVVA